MLRDFRGVTPATAAARRVIRLHNEKLKYARTTAKAVGRGLIDLGKRSVAAETKYMERLFTRQYAVSPEYVPECIEIVQQMVKAD